MTQCHSERHRTEGGFVGDQAGSDIDLFGLVERVRRGDESGLLDLYRLFSVSVRRSLSRTFGDQDVEDLLHDAFLMVVRSIRQGELRDPLRLFGFIHAIMRRHIATVIEKLVLSRTKVADAEWTGRVEGSIYDPEEEFVLRERGRLIREVFSALGDREREVLRRFYLEEQSIGEICRDMRLSETQFRLLKSRAKARFGELGRRRQAPIRRAA